MGQLTLDVEGATRTCPECGAGFELNKIGRPKVFCSKQCARRNSNRSYRLANRDALNEANRRWREANAERHRENARKWYWDNHEHAKGNYARWAKRNPEKARELQRSMQARRRARQRSGAIPYTVAQLAERMAFWGCRCWMCGGEFDEVDHVKPLVAGGIDCLANVRPACVSCNRSKGGRWPFPTEKAGT